MAASAGRRKRVAGDDTTTARRWRKARNGDNSEVKGHGDGRNRLTTKQKFSGGSVMIRRLGNTARGTAERREIKSKRWRKRREGNQFGGVNGREKVSNRLGVAKGIKSNRISGENGRRGNQIKIESNRRRGANQIESVASSREGFSNAASRAGFSLLRLVPQTSRCRVSCGLQRFSGRVVGGSRLCLRSRGKGGSASAQEARDKTPGERSKTKIQTRRMAAVARGLCLRVCVGIKVTTVSTPDKAGNPRKRAGNSFNTY
ncbi:hypothetical protein GGX14DRAFT_397772 [Mycena pura]|uniref:Uncharacterized protein n=1 Tax=Mycena pura TaxID=153505 RepID=A0AAD6V7R1_9AGAR|nr:hypothetical protein GGX14DRAFT_397772 [Mycena pura]